MCFSAEVSFAASAYLGATGIACWKLSESKQEKAVCFLPLTFALHQLEEGLIWVELQRGIGPTPWREILVHSWVFTALFFWPVVFPLLMLFLEKVKWRKYPLGALALSGLALGVYLVSYGMQKPVEAQIVCCHSIQYLYDFDKVNALALTYAYGYLIALALLFSSFRGAWILGVLTAVVFHLSLLYYHQTFTSVWCFFMALVSSGYFYLLYLNKKREKARV